MFSNVRKMHFSAFSDPRIKEISKKNMALGFNLSWFFWPQAPAVTPAELAEPKRPTPQKIPTDTSLREDGAYVAPADVLSLRGDSMSLASEMNISRTVRGRWISFHSGQILFCRYPVQVSLAVMKYFSWFSLAKVFVLIGSGVCNHFTAEDHVCCQSPIRGQPDLESPKVRCEQRF